MSGKKSQVKKVSRASGKTSAKKSSVKQSPYRLVREEDIDYLIQLATSNIEMLSEDPVKNRKAINHIEEELDELLAQKKVLESSKKKEIKGLIKEWKDIIIDEDLTEGSEEYDRRYRQYFFLDTVAREISKEILEKNLVGNLSEIIEVFDKATTMEEIEELDDIAYITDKVQEIVGKDILPDRQAEKIRERIADIIGQEGEKEEPEEGETTSDELTEISIEVINELVPIRKQWNLVDVIDTLKKYIEDHSLTKEADIIEILNLVFEHLGDYENWNEHWEKSIESSLLEQIKRKIEVN